MNRHVASILAISMCFPLAQGCGARKDSGPVTPAVAAKTPPAEPDPPEVPLHAQMTAFILARCPHAAEAVRVLLDVKKQMGGALSLSITYLGLLDDDGNPDPAMGEREIATARIGACVATVSSTEGTFEEGDVEMPDWENDAWLAYLGCQYRGEGWRSGPEGWEACATEAGIDPAAVERCIGFGGGDLVLSGMYAVTTASQIVSSPTVVVDSRLYFGEQSKAGYLQFLCHSAGEAATRPPVCDSVPAPPKITGVLIYDERCSDSEKCDVEGNVAVLERLIPGLELTRQDYGSEEGKNLYSLIQKADTGVKTLPVMVLDERFGENENLRKMLEEYLVPFGKGYLVELGGEWDPTAEICENAVDDNGDGKVDCDDPTCTEKRTCRAEVKNRLDFFMMSGCPFALRALPSVDRLLAHFSRNRQAVDFHLQFIGDIEDGELRSMHGEEEVAEDIRMLCAERLYGKKYKFMEYVLCRAEDPDSGEWEACVPKGMSAAKIRGCVGKEGPEMLKRSFELAENLGVRGSPTWILNNRLPMEGRTLSAMHEAYCEKNEPSGCEKTPEPEQEESEGGPPSQCH